MESITQKMEPIEITQADLKWGKNLHPADGEGRVGAAGIDKTYTLDMVKAIAYRMPERPNILIKAGENAKWYIKKCSEDKIFGEIAKMRNTIFGKGAKRSTLYVIRIENL